MNEAIDIVILCSLILIAVLFISIYFKFFGWLGDKLRSLFLLAKKYLFKSNKN